MARPRWQRLTIRAVKWAVTLVVLWAVGRHVVRTWNDLSAQGRPIHVEPAWLILSGLLYLAGTVAFGCYFARILRSSPTPVGLLPALRAHLVSQLGKYVPGKAMVVVVRAGMVVPFGARASTAAIATFYETLVMMAAGGLIAALGFALAAEPEGVHFTVPFWGPGELPLFRVAALGGSGLGLAFVVVAAPLVFGRLAGLVSSPFPGIGPEVMPRFSGRLLVQGLVWATCGWILLGASQLALVCALDPTRASNLRTIEMAPVVIASVALATVAGFAVAVLPGGLGVREGILMTLLTPMMGSDQAVVASLSLRLVWVATELVAAAVVYPCLRRPTKSV